LSWVGWRDFYKKEIGLSRKKIINIIIYEKFSLSPNELMDQEDSSEMHKGQDSMNQEVE